MTGKLIAIAATDAEYYDMAFVTPYIVISPLAYIGGGIILYIYIGPSAFVALGIVLTYIMILRINVGGIKKLRLNVGKNTDQKLKTLNSLIEAIRVVKMYTWEMRFRDLIKSFRDKEISNERKLAMLISIFLTLFITGHGVVAFMTIGTYVWLGNELTASTAFAAISILYSMQMIAVGQLSYGIEIASMLAAGGNRITNVLTSEQFDEDYASEPSPGYVLELENLRS